MGSRYVAYQVVPTNSIESSGDDGELRSEFVEDREDHVIDGAEIVAITNRTLKWKDKQRCHYLAVDLKRRANGARLQKRHCRWCKVFMCNITAERPGSLKSQATTRFKIRL